MRNLLSANVRRLWLNKAFWYSLLTLTGIECVIGLLLLHQQALRIDIAMYVSLQLIGLLAALFLSTYLGTDYSDGTIRNKLIVGHQRSRIYLASMLTGIIALTIMLAAWGCVGFCFGLIMQIFTEFDLIWIIRIGLLCWMTGLSYCAIFTLIGLLSTNKARTSIICILTAFGLMVIGCFCYSFAQPNFLPETYRLFFQFLFDFNPFGQTFQLLAADVVMFWKLSAYASVLTIFLTGTGVYCFCKKDLK